MTEQLPLQSEQLVATANWSHQNWQPANRMLNIPSATQAFPPFQVYRPFQFAPAQPLTARGFFNTPKLAPRLTSSTTTRLPRCKGGRLRSPAASALSRPNQARNKRKENKELPKELSSTPPPIAMSAGYGINGEFM